MNDGDYLILDRLGDDTLQVDFETGEIYSKRVYDTRLGDKVGLYKLKGYIDKDGYIRIHLRDGDRSKAVAAHKIIYLTYNPLIPDGCVVDHINRVRSDNRLVNLRLLLRSENSDGQIKIQYDTAMLIKGLYLSGDYTMEELALMHDVSRYAIYYTIYHRRG